MDWFWDTGRSRSHIQDCCFRFIWSPTLYSRGDWWKVEILLSLYVTYQLFYTTRNSLKSANIFPFFFSTLNLDGVDIEETKTPSVLNVSYVDFDKTKPYTQKQIGDGLPSTLRNSSQEKTSTEANGKCTAKTVKSNTSLSEKIKKRQRVERVSDVEVKPIESSLKSSKKHRRESWLQLCLPSFGRYLWWTLNLKVLYNDYNIV